MIESSHCEHHSGVTARLEQAEKKSVRNCESVRNLNQRANGFLQKSTFQWFFGILVTVLIVLTGYQYSTLTRIDKNVAVLSEQVNQVKDELKKK